MMRSHLQKGEIGTIIAISALVIIGISSLVSSVFLSKKQITSSKASETCKGDFTDSNCYRLCGSLAYPGSCKSKNGVQKYFTCCSAGLTNTPVPTRPPTTNSVPCLQCNGNICEEADSACNSKLNECHNADQSCGTNVISTIVPVPTVKDECIKDQTSNQGCGVYTCAPDKSRQCKCGKDQKTGSLKWSCLCVPDASCITPTPTPIPIPTAVPASTGLGTGPENQTGAGGSLAFCPDGGIPDTGFAAGACDYGRQSAGNSGYIDKDNPDDCRKCIWVKYDGSFPYGQCHYANNSVCRRGDNAGGCAGVCNATCCSGNSRKENGDVYDQGNVPGSSGNVSSDAWQGGAGAGGGGSVVDTGTGTEEFTADQDTTIIGEKICNVDGSYTYSYCNWESETCIPTVPPEPCSE